MKALSLKQPFAEFVVSGKKSIELRKWNTKFRGEFLVHASLSPEKKAMERFGLENLPCGFIVGKAKLVDVKKYLDEEEFEKDKNKHLANKNWGSFGFALEDAEKFDKPIPAKGKLGFWEHNK
ncbi:MAG: ASCH domain-containing protein [Candidatus Pacearchaeota archaeon]|nr:ASCH domain-containing protein [Candidatus Pacearchaeota archaeon]